MDAHSAMGMAQGFTQDQVQSILENIDGSPLIEDKTELILHFSETIARNSFKIHEGTLQDLRGHGCADAELFESTSEEKKFSALPSGIVRQHLYYDRFYCTTTHIVI